jgi:hypothetical protein
MGLMYFLKTRPYTGTAQPSEWLAVETLKPDAMNLAGQPGQDA